MRMSTRGRFGVRALLHLAEERGTSPTPVSKLARKMDVSPDYLMQLFVKLRRAGLVKSIRGPRGGFNLTRPASKITIGDIVRALEGPIGLTPCISPESRYGGKTKRRPKEICPRRERCAARLVWLDLNSEIERVLDSADLEQVLKRARGFVPISA